MIGGGKRGGSQGGASGIAVIIEADNTQSSYLHENIRIENNLIKGDDNPCGNYIGNVRGVTLVNNKITDCQKDIRIHCATEVDVQ